MNARRFARWLSAAGLVLSSSLLLSGCLATKMYVDPVLPMVSKADLPSTSNPHPAQILFEFQTKGVANATATSELRPRIVTVASESGLFSAVSETPPSTGVDGGVLKIIINNVPLDENAAAKGFGTGLTFGLAGSMVTDGYVCTATYEFDGKITEATVKHAIYTTIGNHSAPEGLKPMQPADAVHQVVDQMAWNALKQLADKGAFK